MQDNKIIICIDMDDTIEDLLHPWVAEINKRYGFNKRKEDMTTWDMCVNFDGLEPSRIYTVLNEPEFWDKVTCYSDAIKYLEKLNEDERFKIYIATNTYYRTVPFKMDKVLFKYFPFLKKDQLITIANKQLLNTDILIDDAPHNLENGTYDKILFNQPHNQKYLTVNLDNKNIEEFDRNVFNSNVVKRSGKWEQIYKYIINKTENNLWRK